MYNSYFLEPSYFYGYLLNQIENRAQLLKILELIERWSDQINYEINWMHVNNVIYPKRFSFLKHQKKQIEIFRIDVLNHALY